MKLKKSYSNILIINIFGIGDVLFTTPLINNIKRARPEVKIGYVCNSRTADVLRTNPDIDKVFIYEKDDYSELFQKSKFAFIKKIMNAVREIKAENFDLVIDISLNSYSSFFMWLIGIKERIGFNYKNRSPWLTHKILLKGYEQRHVVDFYGDFLNFLSVPFQEKKLKLCLSSEDEAWAGNFLAEHNICPNDKLVAIVAGGGASWGKASRYKRWPSEHYAKLADKVVENNSAKIILLGDASERDVCEEIVKNMKFPCLKGFGKTTIGQFAALVSRCQLAILNDGGPLHIAVAREVETISIFGPVDEVVYGPYPKENHKVVTSSIACRPCYRRFRVSDCTHHNCLNFVTVEDVLRKVEEVL